MLRIGRITRSRNITVPRSNAAGRGSRGRTGPVITAGSLLSRAITGRSQPADTDGGNYTTRLRSVLSVLRVFFDSRCFQSAPRTSLSPFPRSPPGVVIMIRVPICYAFVGRHWSRVGFRIMCGKKSALVLYPLTKLTGLLRKHISEHVSRIHFVFLLQAVYATLLPPSDHYFL